MNSFLERMIKVFFEDEERTVKPLMYAQIILFISAPFAWNHFAVMYFLLGTGFLLTGIESFIIKGKKRKDYLIWVFSGLLFYWIAIDNYFLY
ncbi:hypothetical protein CYL18_14615 [Pradoshia eiseniae]|uniref:DUF4181 domain-containing protein n=1 Tax=Pradoshia eiseniae TaxID=2064768 RepID=A0A2S7MXA9_9BACI|nr:hypothetical protein [Pradoshia eiseniae]PQD94442.1 hypothetical protein CYL18_14615 [Pradoshia eiseniae]